MVDNILRELSVILREGSVYAPLIALVAGFLTSLTPCSMSSIPLIIGYVSGTNQKNTRKSFLLSLTFALGTTITFTSLGIASALLQHVVVLVGAWWYLFIGLLMVLMAIQYWEIYYFIHPTNLVNKSNSKGYIGAFISGLLGGLFSSPCATPVMIALMSMITGNTIGANTNIVWAITLFLLYAIGHSIIVILAGTFMGFVGKLSGSKTYERFTNISKIVIGTLIMILGIYFLYLGIEGF